MQNVTNTYIKKFPPALMQVSLVCTTKQKIINNSACNKRRKCGLRTCHKYLTTSEATQ